jgi:hypothetical protein
MFYALSTGRVKIPGYFIEHRLEDIETLNHRAMQGEYEMTAISAHAYPSVAHLYQVMNTGASMGRGYGPVVIATRPTTLDALAGKRIAIPRMDDRAPAYKIYAPAFEKVLVPFDQIMDAVRSGRVDAGVIIHEGQLTYADEGFVKVADFGEIWERETDGLPLPLGLDAVRRDLGPDVIRDSGYRPVGQHPLRLRARRGCDGIRAPVWPRHRQGPEQPLRAHVRVRRHDRHGRTGAAGAGAPLRDGRAARVPGRSPAARLRLEAEREPTGAMTDPRTRPAREPRPTAALLGLLLFLMAVLPGLPGLNGDFIGDDRIIILNNPALRDPGHLPRLFGETYWGVVRAGLCSRSRSLRTLTAWPGAPAGGPKAAACTATTLERRSRAAALRLAPAVAGEREAPF